MNDTSIPQRIEASDNLQDVMVKMAQGNPGALNTLILLAQDPVMGFIDILYADDMGLRGPALWLAYSDYADKDIAKLQAGLRDRDPAIVSAVKRAGYEAVVGGASYR